jgi:hypothetical protein
MIEVRVAPVSRRGLAVTFVLAIAAPPLPGVPPAPPVGTIERTDTLWPDLAGFPCC